MKLVFVYLGPTRKLPACVIEVLPRVTLAMFADNGYFALVWLLFAVELQWKFAR